MQVGGCFMEFNKIKDGRKLTYVLPTRLDPVSLMAFEEEVNKDLGTIDQLTLDLIDLDFISSSTIRVFIDLHLKLERNFIILNPNDEVMEIFEMTGLDKTLNIVR